MRELAIVFAAFAVTASLSFAARETEAKGPFQAEISGGDLAGAVIIPQEIEEADIFGGTLEAEPASCPASGWAAYEVTLFAFDPDDGQRLNFMRLMYYPVDSGEAAAFRNEVGECISVGPRFQTLLDEHITRAPKSLPAGGGAPSDDGRSSLWYIAPSLALSFVLISGLAGLRLLMRRAID